VLATADYVYAGGRKLQRYPLLTAAATKPDGTWHQLTTNIDSSLRGHTTNPQIRAIDIADANRLIVVGQFDWIDGTDAAHEKKVAVMVDTATGTPDIAANGGSNWTLNCDCARQESSAFGLAVDVEGSVAYIGAGGNDWAGAFNISDGSKLWQTDANGSVQDIAFYDASNVILGGHFTSVEIAGATDESGSECPSRNLQDQSPCMLQPRLAAVDTLNGLANQNWHPTVCCLYRGVWATTVERAIDGTTPLALHIGGEFTTVGGVKHNYYARFSDATGP
jgi:outer membrane protein assembly factor BamB